MEAHQGRVLRPSIKDTQLAVHGRRSKFIYRDVATIKSGRNNTALGSAAAAPPSYSASPHIKQRQSAIAVSREDALLSALVCVSACN